MSQLYMTLMLSESNSMKCSSLRPGNLLQPSVAGAEVKASLLTVLSEELLHI